MRVPIPYLIFKVILQPYALLPSKHLRPLDQLLLPASVSLIALFATFIRLAASSWDNPALTRASFSFLAVNSDILTSFKVPIFETNIKMVHFSCYDFRDKNSKNLVECSQQKMYEVLRQLN